MAAISLMNVTKDFGDRKHPIRAVDDLTLDIRDRELLVLLGPSGCGKTTTLRLVAGLEHTSTGTIAIGGNRVNDVAPKDRDVAMVFQDYALYPHLSVYDNLAFGLKMRRTPRDEIRQRVGEVAKLLALDELLARRPHSLSGGQKQRVAFGRAIVRRPNGTRNCSTKISLRWSVSATMIAAPVALTRRTNSQRPWRTNSRNCPRASISISSLLAVASLSMGRFCFFRNQPQFDAPMQSVRDSTEHRQ